MTSTSDKTLSARRVMSSRLPIGVATMYRVPGISRVSCPWSVVRCSSDNLSRTEYDRPRRSQHWHVTDQAQRTTDNGQPIRFDVTGFPDRIVLLTDRRGCGKSQERIDRGLKDGAPPNRDAC